MGPLCESGWRIYGVGDSNQKRGVLLEIRGHTGKSASYPLIDL